MKRDIKHSQMGAWAGQLRGQGGRAKWAAGRATPGSLLRKPETSTESFRHLPKGTLGTEGVCAAGFKGVHSAHGGAAGTMAPPGQGAHQALSTWAAPVS